MLPASLRKSADEITPKHRTYRPRRLAALAARHQLAAIHHISCVGNMHLGIVSVVEPESRPHTFVYRGVRSTQIPADSSAFFLCDCDVSPSDQNLHWPPPCPRQSPPPSQIWGAKPIITTCRTAPSTPTANSSPLPQSLREWEGVGTIQPYRRHRRQFAIHNLRHADPYFWALSRRKEARYIMIYHHQRLLCAMINHLLNHLPSRYPIIA